MAPDGPPVPPWYYLFWPPLRWGVYLTYEILKEAFLREGRKAQRRQRNRG